VADYHNRMPVMLNEETRWLWLDSCTKQSTLLEMLVPYPAAEMKCFPVSKEINSPKNDRADLLLPEGG
jgi:putative SOS response-associated peptidase YedK